MSDLPSSWEWATIGELAQYIQRGKSPKYAERSELPVINQKCIRWDELQTQHLKFIHPDQFSAWDSARYIAAGDILWNSTGTGTVGRAYLVKPADCAQPKVVDSHVTIVRHVPDIDARYLFNWIKAPAVQSKIEEMCDGTTNQIELSRSAVVNTPVPVAPVAEQIRIANQLATLLSRIQACNDRFDSIAPLLQRFRRAVIRAAVSGELAAQSQKAADDFQTVNLGDDSIRIPGSWKVVALEQVIEASRPLCYGVVQPGGEQEGGVPLVRVQDMNDGTVAMDQLRTVSASVDQEYKRSRVQEGDLLVSVVGTIGRTAIVPAGFSGNIARAVARVACREDVCSTWVHYWLSSDWLQWFLLTNAREVARKTLNLSDLARVPIALPEWDEQQAIVDRVKALFAYADRIEARYAAARTQAQRLSPLVLAKAFRGELVPQDPNDEPASALLARIAAERELGSASPKAAVSRKPRLPGAVRAPKEKATMTKSRSDDDVSGKPYLAGHLRRIGKTATAEELFKVAELPIADFYKQLAWEVTQGHINDGQTTLEVGDAA